MPAPLVGALQDLPSRICTATHSTDLDIRPLIIAPAFSSEMASRMLSLVSDKLSQCAQGICAHAGEAAVHYFEQTNPGYPRFGAGSTSDNHAEWIVDLTTKVASYHLSAKSPEAIQRHCGTSQLLALKPYKALSISLWSLGGSSTRISRRDRGCCQLMCLHLMLCFERSVEGQADRGRQLLDPAQHPVCRQSCRAVPALHLLSSCCISTMPAGGQGRQGAGVCAALPGERAVRGQRRGPAARPGAARGQPPDRQGAARAPGHQHALLLRRQDHPQGPPFHQICSRAIKSTIAFQ